MNFISHSRNKEGNEHSLSSHLLSVSEIMTSFIDNPLYKATFKIAGLLHDFGKYQPAFQKYLKEGGRRGSVPHASWGASLAIQNRQYEAAFAIDGHHKGIPDFSDLKDIRQEFEDPEHVCHKIEKTFLEDIRINDSNLKSELMSFDDKSEREVFIRFLFSALTDADWLDTESHFNKEVTEKRTAPYFDADFMLNKLEEEISKKGKDGNINKLRNKVREYAIRNANGNPGFYSMTLPTGMGKTLTSLCWALYHAKYNNCKRIIIVLPYISIIDQTAKELKRILGDEWVLEHHSCFNEDEESNHEIASENIESEVYTKRLATENWDYPIIVTTSVQFFESLYSNKPARCRKVHNIARSVVIFDEVQTFPKELVLTTLSMLRNVRRVMDTSFLFCTATQPAFEQTENFAGIENIVSLVENPEEIFNATRRVIFSPVNHYNPVDISELARLVLEKDISVLNIFNTKKSALLFYKEIRKDSDCRLFHLSTSMYPVHRKRLIEDIRECLKKQEKIIVASTQLIEAGVDFDFPCVFREIAPLESIIQSAGRCNREGKMNKLGNVFIFSLEDASAPNRQYRSLAEFANTLYKDNEELLFEHDFFTDYYRKAFRLFIPDDKFNIEQNRQSLNFKKVDESYHIIDNVTIPVFIMCDESRVLYENIRYKPVLSRSDYRAMQQYSVQVYDNFFKDNIGKLGREPQGYWLWHGEYSNEYGISTEHSLFIL